jgi:hypothetical protein
MRKLQIKFPNQIRISGWDFGSSARAMNQAGGKDSLMTYECEFPQAELGKGLNSTTERKSMSTKTTIKRIALVAVSALGLGVLTSVAPVNAAERDASSITVGTIGASRVGASTTVAVSFVLPSATATSDTTTIVARLISAPTGSNLSAVSASNNLDNSSGAYLGWATNSTVADSTFTSGSYSDVQLTSGLYTVAHYGELASADGTDDTLTANLSFKPDVAGSYTVQVSNGDTAYTAGNASTTITFTTGGAPTSVVLSSVSTTAGEGSAGSLIKVVLKDAAGNVTIPNADEAFLVTTSGSFTISDATLSASDFATYQAAYFNVSDSAVDADTTETISVTGSGAVSSSVVTTTSVTIMDITDETPTVSAFSRNTAVTTGYATAATAETADLEYQASGVTSHSVKITFSATPSSSAATYYNVDFTDTDGKITGKVGGTFGKVITVAAAGTTGTTSVTADLGTSSNTTFLATLTGGTAGGADTVAFGGGTAAQDSVEADNVTVALATGASITLYATIYDQFGVEMPNQTVNVSVTGRNATTSSVAKSSDADGRVSYTLTDAATATGSSSTVTFAGSSAGTDSVTINWGAFTVGTVTVTGGASEDTVAYPAAGSTTAAISTAVAGAAGATTTFTALVKDASGNVLAGVPVTWTVDKATAGITKSATSDSSISYTDSLGKATTTVFSWAAPSKVTVTATAGGKTGTGHQNYVNAASDARVLSGTANGNVVTAKVVDRYGNAVAGVTVTAKTSSGYFGSGANSTSGVTDENGEIGFAVTGGNATVTLKVDSGTYTQTDDAAGYVGTTAVTASVAGTTTGVGASLAPAGVNSVSVETSAATSTSDAIDAANEATDAANAATDAANAAAEAADAATAAAQDAQAAVAELATKVASLIAGIKAQITTLTNLVIKIQKKVRA